MNLSELKDINKGKLKNAEWRKKVFEDAVKHVKISVNQNGLSEAKCDVEFYSTIEQIIKSIEKWYELLKLDGSNTKHQVVVDIEKMLEYSKSISEKENKKEQEKNEKDN